MIQELILFFTTIIDMLGDKGKVVIFIYSLLLIPIGLALILYFIRYNLSRSLKRRVK